MRRCPKCNRTYTNDTQKFCTKDGTSLVDVAASSPGLGETVRLDSADLKTTQDDPEVTKVILRELASQPAEEFDPYKTIVSRPQETRAEPSLTTGDLMAPSIPPPPTRAISQPLNSGSIEPPPPQPVPPSGPISPPSQPLQNASGDLGQMTMASFAPPPPATAPSGQLATAAAPAAAPVPVAAKKKSKLPLVLGILAVLVVLGLGVVGVAYWFVVRPMLEARRVERVDPQPPREPTPIVENTPSESPPTTDNPVKEVPAYTPPADAVQFVNSKDKLDGRLAEHYVDFSFYYPERWQKDPTAGVRGATNFAKVQRQLAADAPQEIFAVGWYDSTGSSETDQLSFPRLVEQRNSQSAKEYPEYQKVSEGATKVGPYDAYELRFTALYRNTERGDIKILGRVIFVPPVDGSRKGVTLLVWASSLAPEVKNVDDVGVKGELPMLLESFRFGKSQ